MKAKNRDQSLSDSRELDGSYDQLTGEWTMCVYVCVCDRLQDEKIQYAKLVIWVRVSSDGSEVSQPVCRASHHPRKKNYVYLFIFCARIFFVAQVYVQVLYFNLYPPSFHGNNIFPVFDPDVSRSSSSSWGDRRESDGEFTAIWPPKTSRIESFTVRVACRCGCVMYVGVWWFGLCSVIWRRQWDFCRLCSAMGDHLTVYTALQGWQHLSDRPDAQTVAPEQAAVLWAEISHVYLNFTCRSLLMWKFKGVDVLRENCNIWAPLNAMWILKTG